jgi:hypothetical protein
MVLTQLEVDACGIGVIGHKIMGGSAMPETDERSIATETAAAAPLPYAASLVRDRVSVERGTNYLRVISPPMGSWRDLPWGYWVAGAFFGLYAIGAFFRSITSASADDRNGALAAVASFGGALLVVCAFAYDRVRRSYVFELTDRTFALTRLSPWGPLTARIWRRDAIGAIAAVYPPGMIMIQVIGSERILLRIATERAPAEIVAGELREGLAAPVVPAPRPQNLPPGEIQPPQALPRGMERTALLVTAFALAGFGVVIGIVFTNVYIAMIPIILAGIPAGMALGTQKKDYYW